MTAFARQHPVPPLVCLVDGDAGIRRGLRRFLGTHDLDVRAYATAGELLRELPDRGVIVTDASLPDLDALQLLDELARRGSTRPVIVLASHRDLPLAEKALRRGAIDLVEKPFVDSVLVSRIQSALERAGEGRS